MHKLSSTKLKNIQYSLRSMKIKKKTLFVVLLLILIIAFFIFKSMNKANYVDNPQPKVPLGNGEIKILEYADLQCPACKTMHPILKKILSEYEGKVSYEFKHFPLVRIHQNAMLASEALECANDFGKFYEFMDMAYERQNEFDNKVSSKSAKKVFKSIASDLGIISSFNDCLDSGVKSSYVRFELSEANKLRLTGTPSIFVNGNKVDNSYDDVVDAVKKA